MGSATSWTTVRSRKTRWSPVSRSIWTATFPSIAVSFLYADTRAASIAWSTTSFGRFFSAASWVMAIMNSLFTPASTSRRSSSHRAKSKKSGCHPTLKERLFQYESYHRAHIDTRQTADVVRPKRAEGRPWAALLAPAKSAVATPYFFVAPTELVDARENTWNSAARTSSSAVDAGQSLGLTTSASCSPW